MRLLSFNALRNCKFKAIPTYLLPRGYSSDIVQPQPQLETEKAAEGELVSFHASWAADEHAELRARVLRDLRILPEFVSEREEGAFLLELEPVLRRMRYEFDHWDNAIHGYRETERGEWRSEAEAALVRVRALAFGGGVGGEPMPRAHVLDLAAAGHIKPHVDAVRFCGEVIAGLCLSSTAVMRLVHTQHQHLVLDALLPRRCLYVMRGVARYQFTHAVLGGEESVFRGERVPRYRRVAVITRSRPEPEPQTQPADP